jgi:hypothetical protein
MLGKILIVNVKNHTKPMKRIIVQNADYFRVEAGSTYMPIYIIGI